MAVERIWRVGFFDPALGGDPLLFQNMFWFYSHPAVYIMILPGMGVTSELIATFARKPVFGYRSVALASVASAVLGFMVAAALVPLAGVNIALAFIDLHGWNFAGRWRTFSRAPGQAEMRLPRASPQKGVRENPRAGDTA